MLRFTSLALTLCLWGSVFSQDIKYKIYKVENAPVIDGVKDEVWNSVPCISDLLAIKELPHETEPDGFMDCGATFHALWDENYLYFYAQVFDDVLKADRIGLGKENSPGYNDDCFEIFLDGDYSHGDGFDGTNDCELWFLWKEDRILTYRASMLPFSTDDIVYAQKDWVDSDGNTIGWMMEVRFPLDVIQVPAVSGTIIGMDLKYGDDDGNEVNPNLPGTDREHNMRWCGDFDQHPPSTWFAVQLHDEIIDK